MKPETIQRRADKPVATVAKSFHDDYIKANAKVRNDLGLKPILQRITSSTACKWCQEVAGRFRFGEQPEDVFRRHDNCDCVIIYDTQVLRGVKTEDGGRSKTWEEVDPQQVMAEGFKATTLSQEEARELQENALSGLTLAGKRDIIEARGSDALVLENQRYGRNKNTLVNHSYIEGGKYKRKFDRATDDAAVNKALYDCAKSALNHRSGTELEDMFWIDPKNGKVVYAVTDSTDKRAIIYTEKLKAAIKDRTDLITIHSHPSSMPPSIDDFNSAYKNGYQVGFVACHNGKLFRYSSKQEVSKALYNLYISEYLEAGMNEFDAQMQTLTKLTENHAISFTEVF